MADIHQVISLGIGTPSDVPHFLLLGLSINVVLLASPDVTIEVRQDIATIRCLADVGTVELP